MKKNSGKDTKQSEGLKGASEERKKQARSRKKSWRSSEEIKVPEYKIWKSYKSRMKKELVKKTLIISGKKMCFQMATKLRRRMFVGHNLEKIKTPATDVLSGMCWHTCMRATHINTRLLLDCGHPG